MSPHDTSITARRPFPWPLMLAALVLLATLAALLSLRQQLRSNLDQTARSVVNLFGGRVLGDPGSRSILFSDIERNAAIAAGQAQVLDVLIFKNLGSGPSQPGFHLVHPHDLAFEGDDPRAHLEQLGFAWHEIDGDDGATGPLGAVALRLDVAALRAVDLTVGSTGLMLLAAAAGLLRRLRRQELRLHSTRIELEEKRRQIILLERLSLAGRLSAALLHDLRKPVEAIRAQALDQLDAGDAPEPWGDIRRQTELFMAMLQSTRLERFARSGAMPASREDELREWCDLADMVQRSLQLVEHERGGVATGFTACPELLLIEANPHEIIQILSNLILNAFQAMKGTGTLEITLGAEVEPRRARITVRDSGPGVPVEEREAIFAPFHTLRESEGGSGLGLYVSRELARQLGGELRLLPTQAPGATFELVLPCVAGPPAA